MIRFFCAARPEEYVELHPGMIWVYSVEEKLFAPAILADHLQLQGQLVVVALSSTHIIYAEEYPPKVLKVEGLVCLDPDLDLWASNA
jgi:hypothetical protein